MATRAELYDIPALRVAAALRTAFAAVVLGGGVAAVATGGADWTAIPLVAGAAGTAAAQLTVGILGYRRAMGREWPRVAPATDEDDW